MNVGGDKQADYSDEGSRNPPTDIGGGVINVIWVGVYSRGIRLTALSKNWRRTLSVSRRWSPSRDIIPRTKLNAWGNQCEPNSFQSVNDLRGINILDLWTIIVGQNCRNTKRGVGILHWLNMINRASCKKWTTGNCAKDMLNNHLNQLNSQRKRMNQEMSK